MILRAVALLLPLLVAACGGGGELRIFPPNYQTLDTKGLQQVLEEQSPVDLVLARPEPGSSSLEALVNDQADLSLVENSAAFVPGVRAVLPVYESVLHVLARQDFHPASVEQPLRGASIHVSSNSSAGRAFIEVVTRRQGLDAGDFELVDTVKPGETDLILYFGPIDPGSPNWYLPGYELMSLDDRLNPQHQFYREGVGYLVPNTKPREIPAHTYDIPGNEKAILTVAVDTLMVTRKDVPVRLVFELTRTLIEQKPRFVAVAPHLFSGISESFDPLDLNFPLHAGARAYLQRDEPGLVERYAETINMMVYLLFVLLTSFLGLARWRARRKKDRVDTFYVRVLAIQDRLGEEDPAVLLRELAAIEREAFDSLVAEKLAADESFRIFTDLLARVRAELR